MNAVVIDFVAFSVTLIASILALATGSLIVATIFGALAAISFGSAMGGVVLKRIRNA